MCTWGFYYGPGSGLLSFAKSRCSLDKMLAIFQGPDAYVSPSWYERKRLDGKVVPTWNYVVVQATGTLAPIDDEPSLLRHLEALTWQNEQGRTKPWRVDDAPDDYIRGLMKAIVGLRLSVDTVEGAWKMIQHRSAGDRRGAIEGLEEAGSRDELEVARIMRELERERTG